MPSSVLRGRTGAVRFRRQKFFFGFALPILLVSLLLIWGLPYLLDPEHYRNSLQKALSAQLGKEVTFAKAEVGLRGGLGIALEDFRVRDRSQSYDLFRSQRLILTIRTLPLLLRREVKWKRVTLEKPAFRLYRDRSGKVNFLDLPPDGERAVSTPQKMVETLASLSGGTLSIRAGELSYVDESLGGTPLVTEIRNLDLRLSKIARDTPFLFQVRGQVLQDRQRGAFSISGTFEGRIETFDLLKAKLKAEANLKGIEVSHFWPYLKPLLPMKRVAGLLDLKLKYEGSLSGPFLASAKIQLKEVTYEHPQVFAYVFTPPWVHLEVEAKYDKETLEVPTLSVELPEIKVKAKGRIYGIGTREMGMDAEASSNLFDIAEGRKFIPFRIITPRVSEPLFRAEGNGPVQILSVKLSGKIPEIDHCDELKNAHVLSVAMRLHNARLQLPFNLPPLEELKGQLLFKQGHLHLKEITGRVFHSSIERADGTFYELLQVPTLEVKGQGQFQMADLLALLKTDVLAEDQETAHLLRPITSLSGRASYQLRVKGVLKSPLTFQHWGSYHLSKIHLTHNQIPLPVSIGEGNLNLSNGEVQWTEARVEFGNSSLLTNGSIKRGGPSEVMAKGKIDLKNLHLLVRSPILPAEARQKAEEIKSLSGTGQLFFKGKRSIPIQPFAYELEFTPREANLLLKRISYPILIRDGTLSLTESGAIFSRLKVQILHSSLLLDGTFLKGILNLSASGSFDLRQLHYLLQNDFSPESVRTVLGEVQEPAGFAEFRLYCSGRIEQGFDLLREGEISLKGLSFRHRTLPVPLSQIEGKVLLSQQRIRWEKLKGKMGDSPVHLSIGISRAPEGTGENDSRLARRLEIHLTSPQLDLDALFPEKDDRSPASFEKIGGWLSRWNLEGKVEIERGKYRRMEFTDLKFEMKMIDGRLILRPFEFKANGGMLWGEAWVQPSKGGIRFEMRPRLSHMEAPPLLRTLLKKEERGKVMVTGKVYVDQVRLSGEGGDFQEIKGSLQGGLRLELENGVIEKANILSKIFSLLNVSQIFKGRFPDLKTRGLPFQRITATFQVKDGVATTEDFLVDSDAMRITAVGKVDLGKNLIDAKVGVHPLGTVDTILSHIPIAGYILTGKDRAFLSYFYEVRGGLEDPDIEAIPFKMIGEGLVGLFKRLLETPLKPFRRNHTDKK